MALKDKKRLYQKRSWAYFSLGRRPMRAHEMNSSLGLIRSTLCGKSRGRRVSYRGNEDGFSLDVLLIG